MPQINVPRQPLPLLACDLDLLEPETIPWQVREEMNLQQYKQHERMTREEHSRAAITRFSAAGIVLFARGFVWTVVGRCAIDCILHATHFCCFYLVTLTVLLDRSPFSVGFFSPVPLICFRVHPLRGAPLNVDNNRWTGKKATASKTTASAARGTCRGSRATSGHGCLASASTTLHRPHSRPSAKGESTTVGCAHQNQPF